MIEHVCIIQAFLIDNFLSDFRFHPLPLAISFILGTVFGCVINIFTILFCRNRYKDIFLYSKMSKANDSMNAPSEKY